MFYNKLVLLGFMLLLAGCATSTLPSKSPESGPTSSTQAHLHEVDTDIAAYALAMANIKLNKLDQAQELLTQLTQKHPELAGPWANLALIEIKRHHHDKAKADLDKALLYDPNMAQAYNLLGYINKQNGHIDKARHDFTKAITLKPDYALAHYNLALLYDIYYQDVPKALAHYKRYQDLTAGEDTRTANWVKELERTLKRQTP